jgi:AcrR family transcriptional regulator
MNNIEQNLKFNQIVSTAKDLFYRFGIKRVTIEEICREANVSKMTFYKFFPNKIELAKYLLKFVFDKAIQEYVDIVENDQPFAEKLKMLIDLKRRSSDNISEEFIHELLQQPEPDIAAIYATQREKSFAITMDFFKRAQKDGDIRPDIKLEFIPFILNKMVDMSSDEALGFIYQSPQEYILEMTNFFFYGVLKRD